MDARLVTQRLHSARKRLDQHFQKLTSAVVQSVSTRLTRMRRTSSFRRRALASSLTCGHAVTQMPHGCAQVFTQPFSMQGRRYRKIGSQIELGQTGRRGEAGAGEAPRFRSLKSKIMMQHIYEVRPHKDRGGVDLISDALPFGRLWFRDAKAAVIYARFLSRTDRATVIVNDASGAVLHKHEFSNAETA